MKRELGKRTREIQRDWYGKRGISLHGFYVVAQVNQSQRSAEVIDLCSNDTKQDTGPHYHNSGFLVYLLEVNQVFILTLVEYNSFEAGEGKTVLDTHFAHISHKIIRWVRVGNNLESGEQLGDLLMLS